MIMIQNHRALAVQAVSSSGHSIRTLARPGGSYGDLLADVDADGDEEGVADGDVLTVADADGDADGRTDGEAVAVGDADADADARTDGEAVAVGWYVPVYEGALAEYDALGETDGLADAPEELCAADAEAAGADVCAVACS